MPDLNQIKQGEQGHGTAVGGRTRRGGRAIPPGDRPARATRRRLPRRHFWRVSPRR
jgi:hypothetical protein